MRFIVRALWLAMAFALTACGRFGFELHSIGLGPGTEPTDGDAAIIPDSDGAVSDMDAAALNDGQVAFPDSGDASSATSDGGTSMPLDPACSVPVMPLAAAPVHRYAFDGTGTAVIDLVGSADGVILGGATLNGGALTLDGDSDFVDLPNGLISSLTATTIMLWVEWDSGPQRQVLFDFGSSLQGEGVSGSAETSIALFASQPASGLSVQLKTPSLSLNGSTASTLALGQVQQLALEILPSKGELRLYRDGVMLSSRTVSTFSLSDIRDVNVWLGRGQASADSRFRGTLHEARIYDRALGECAILAAFRAGPDTTSFARCAQPEPDCTFTRYAQLGAWACPTQQIWSIAGQRCADAGMHLVSVNDAAENDALLQELGSTRIWNGYNDLTQEGAFVWCGPGSTFTNFASGEPSSVSTADCVQREAVSTSWRAVDCDSAAAFACEP